MNVVLLALVFVLTAAPVDDDTFVLQMTRRNLPAPSTLDEFTEQVRRMRQLGGDHALIADYVSRVVGKRLVATNKVGGESLILSAEEKETRDRRWKPIDDYMNGRDGLSGRAMDDGRKGERLAQLAWECEVGNCAESAAVSYTVIKNAGIPVRIFSSSMGGGHEFALIGLAPNADPNDPSTWGPDAWVVDGWVEASMSPEQARDNRWIFDGRPGRGPVVSDQTQGFDNPKATEYLAQMGSKGVVEVTVHDEKGKPIEGAVVTLRAQEPLEATTTAQGTVRFKSYPGASATIDVAPPKDSGYAPGQATVPVESRRVMPVTIVLKEAAEVLLEVESPSDNTETEAKEVAVTGRFKNRGTETVSVLVNGKQQAATADDDAAGTFQATAALEMGKNTIQVVMGQTKSAVLNVTRVDKAKNPWDGTWRGTIKTSSESSNGTKNSLQYNAVLKITKGDSAIEMEHEDKMPDGQTATGSMKIPLKAPLIAMEETSKEFPTTDISRGNRAGKTIWSIREGRIYLDCQHVATSYSRSDPKDPWQKLVTTYKATGAFTRDP